MLKVRPSGCHEETTNKKTLMEIQKIGEQQKLARTGIYLEKVGHVLESNIDEAEELLKP